MRKPKEPKILNIEKNLYPNKGVCTYDGMPVIVKGGIPGQKVAVRFTRKRANHREGKIIEILEKGPLETQAPCPAFGRCGGCTYQELTYEDEKALKTDQLKLLFEGASIPIDVQVESSPLVEGYRNKMEYTFGDEVKDGPLMLGLHRKGRFYEIVDTTGCTIVHPDFERIRAFHVAYFRDKGQTYYHKRNKKGLLRHLVVRYALTTGQIMINLVTTSQEGLDVEAYVNALKDLTLDGTLTTIVHTTNDAIADAVIPEKVEILHGPGFINEEVLGLHFSVSPFSFFQPNVYGAENLYTRVRDFLGEAKTDRIYDLYSGTGTIGQIVAERAAEVIGVEIVEEAVSSANENAIKNGLTNVTFRANDVLKELDDLTDPVDVIILDPPREGIHPKALGKILDLKPSRFIYVSCNPTTLVRDLEAFLGNGYTLEKSAFFDQFPRTVHVETVVLITRVNK